jgi:hypothetical protein
MVSEVSAKVWSRTGDQRSLPQAHADTVADLERVGGRGIYPVTEGAISQMRAEIGRLTPPAKYDPATREAAAEFHTATQRLQQLCFDLAGRQRRLAYLKDDPAHKLLGDILPAMLVAPPDPQTVIIELFGRERLQSYNPAGVFDTPTFSTASEYRQATLALQARLGELDNIRARIASVLQFETYRPEDKNQALIFRLASQVNALQERLNYLEQQQSTPSNNRSRRK